ncbi:MAG TPA: hypothetical protein VFO46_02515 [Candidatus Sulfotelmatobacter sp.]|nr:hypothetical protein [Candidatus Sulfotelmatobacter sp.]
MSVLVSAAGAGKVLWVDNGGTIPSGWQAPSFNDSSWSAPVLQTAATFGPAVTGSDWITDTASGRNPLSHDLFRFHLNLASGFITAQIVISTDNFIENLYVNGTLVYQNTTGFPVPGPSFAVYPAVTVNIPISNFAVGDNVIAIEVLNDTAPMATNPISLSFALTVVVTTGGWFIVNEPSLGLTDRSNYLHFGDHGGQHSFQLQLRNRGQATVNLEIPAGDSYAPTIGSPCYLFDVTATGSTLVYCGTIDKLEYSWIGNAGDRVIVATLVSLEQVFDTIIVPPRVYVNQNAGTIFSDLLTLAAGSPVSPGTISAGQFIPNFRIADYSKISESFDKLATLSNFIWRVDPGTQQVHFTAPPTITAPFTLTRQLYESLEYTLDRQDFRDRQILKLPHEAFGHSSELFVGAGQKNFTLLRPCDSVVNAWTTFNTQNHATATFTGQPAANDTITFGFPQSGSAYNWAASSAYATDQIIIDPNGHVQRVTVSGTSGGSMPAWDDLGGITTDNTVQWRDEGITGLSLTDTWTYTFVTSLDNTQFGQVLIRATLALTLQALADAINNVTSQAGITFSLPTWENPLVNADTPAGSTSVVVRNKAAGSGYVASLSKSSSVVTWSGTTTSGGTTTFGTETISVGVFGETAARLVYIPGRADFAISTPLNVGSYLQVEYTRADAGVIQVEDTALVGTRAAIEHGTGKYQQITDDSDQTSLAAGLLEAQQALSAFKMIPTTIKFATYKPGLSPGQFLEIQITTPSNAAALINSPVIGTPSWLVQEVVGELIPTDTYIPNFGHYKYSITCISVAQIGSYLDFWEKLGGGGGGGTGGGSATGVLVAGPSSGSQTSTPQIFICTQATFPPLTTQNAGQLILVTDYCHLILWDGTSASFVDEGNRYYAGFEHDPGPGWALADGSAVNVLNANGSTSSVTTKNLTGSPAYLKFGSAYGGINAAVAAGITGSTASSTAGITVGTTAVQSGSGATVVDSVSDPGHVHAHGTLVNDTTAEPANIVLRPWFRL